MVLALATYILNSFKIFFTALVYYDNQLKPFLYTFHEQLFLVSSQDQISSVDHLTVYQSISWSPASAPLCYSFY